ncbi:MAG: hypothetical protein ACI9OH_003845 [Oleispira sp.]|jgi:hypothetical protein
MLFTLTLIGQLLMLLVSVWMLKSWPPKEEAPGWFSAAFCSGLLISSFAASRLLTYIIELTPMYWFEQLAFYAAFPLLSFVLLALAFNIDWPKEAWGRILLGVCGIYWVCQQAQSLDYLLAASALISSFGIAKLLLSKTAGVCVKQANLALSVAAFASLVILLHSLDANPVAAELAAKWPLELALGLLLAAINRGLFLKQSSSTY